MAFPEFEGESSEEVVRPLGSTVQSKKGSVRRVEDSTDGGFCAFIDDGSQDRARIPTDRCFAS
jgi:hypothetical protein